MAKRTRSRTPDQNIPDIPSRAELERAGIRILVGIPFERNIRDVAFTYFWEIARRGWPLITKASYARTDINRNRMGQTLLDSDYTHLMMLDIDHLHPSDVVERHARWVLQDPSRLVVGGLHFRRGEPFDPCVYVLDSQGQAQTPVYWKPGLMEVIGLGHGTILVSRKALEQLSTPWWAYTYAHVKEDVWTSEDLFFSYLCREAGIKMWCDTTTTSPHLFTEFVDESVFRLWLARNPQSIRVDSEGSDNKTDPAGRFNSQGQDILHDPEERPGSGQSE